MTQTDSRISEKTQRSCDVLVNAVGGSSQGGAETMYLHESAATDDVVGEDEIPEGRDDESAEKTVHAEFPGLLALACTRINAGHEEDDVKGRERVKDLAPVRWCALKTCKIATMLCQ